MERGMPWLGKRRGSRHKDLCRSLKQTEGSLITGQTQCGCRSFTEVCWTVVDDHAEVLLASAAWQDTVHLSQGERKTFGIPCGHWRPHKWPINNTDVVKDDELRNHNPRQFRLPSHPSPLLSTSCGLFLENVLFQFIVQASALINETNFLWFKKESVLVK